MQFSQKWSALFMVIFVVAWYALSVDAGKKRKSNEIEPECEDGLNWKQDCNDCFCAKGRVRCTLKDCWGSEQGKSEEMQDDIYKVNSCEDDTTWKEDCNTCICTMGIPACTRMACGTDKDSSSVCRDIPDSHLCPQDCSIQYYTDVKGCKACRCKEEDSSSECRDIPDSHLCPQDCSIQYYTDDKGCKACRCKEGANSSNFLGREIIFEESAELNINSSELCPDISESDLCPQDCPVKLYTNKNGCKACRCRKKGY